MLWNMTARQTWFAVPDLGRRMPATSRAQAPTAQMRNPGTNVPRISREAPTTIGEMNIPRPAIVSEAPQTTAIFFGVIHGSCMGSVRNIGW